jgi:hypothetical protein
MTATTTISPSSRPSGRWLPAHSLLVAGGAVALGVVAITTDDVSDRPAQIVIDPSAPVPAESGDLGVDGYGATASACRGQARLARPCYE